MIRKVFLLRPAAAYLLAGDRHVMDLVGAIDDMQDAGLGGHPILAAW